MSVIKYPKFSMLSQDAIFNLTSSLRNDWFDFFQSKYLRGHGPYNDLLKLFLKNVCFSLSYCDLNTIYDVKIGLKNVIFFKTFVTPEIERCSDVNGMCLMLL